MNKKIYHQLKYLKENDVVSNYDIHVLYESLYVIRQWNQILNEYRKLKTLFISPTFQQKRRKAKSSLQLVSPKSTKLTKKVRNKKDEKQSNEMKD
ncbi:MAG: hypothetical protein ACOCQD_02355 [archaeon]